MKCPYCQWPMEEQGGTAVGLVCWTIGCPGRGIIKSEATVIDEQRLLHEAAVDGLTRLKS